MDFKSALELPTSCHSLPLLSPLGLVFAQAVPSTRNTSPFFLVISTHSSALAQILSQEAFPNLWSSVRHASSVLSWLYICTPVITDLFMWKLPVDLAQSLILSRGWKLAVVFIASRTLAPSPLHWHTNLSILRTTPDRVRPSVGTSGLLGAALELNQFLGVTGKS